MTNGGVWTQDGLIPLEAAARLVRLMPVACALVDHEGRCIEHSRMLLTESGSLVQRLAGRLCMQGGKPQQQWLAALARTAVSGDSAAFSCSLPGGESWRIHLVPICCETGALPGAKPLFLVTVAQLPNTLTPSLHGRFTPAEMEVLAGLLKGYGAKQIAKDRRASVHTIRTQITSILHKAGLHSQRELIASFASSAFDANAFETGAMPGAGDQLRGTP